MDYVDYVPDGFKVYETKYGQKFAAREKSCFFCDHFSDMFCDFAGNPFLICCDKYKNTGKGMKGECEFWADDTLK